MSVLNEPRKPDCDVCDWATSSWWAHGLNLCQADFELIRKVVKTEQERIIKLLEQLEAVGSDPDTADYIWTEELIALIKGENK